MQGLAGIISDFFNGIDPQQTSLGNWSAAVLVCRYHLAAIAEAVPNIVARRAR
jgi:hypothetical protein